MSDSLGPPSLESPNRERAPSASSIYFHVNETQSGAYGKSGKSTSKFNDTTTATTEPQSTTNSMEMQKLPARTEITSPSNTGRELELKSSSSAADVLKNEREGIEESDEGKDCYGRKKGWNRAAVWITIFIIFGVIDWVVPLFFPAVVMRLLRSQVCDKLCVAIPPSDWVYNVTDPNNWNINKFLTNSNRSWWPTEYFTVYLYNVTNSDAVIAGTQPRLNVSLIGPYVFTTYRQKYNVSFSADNEQVFYNSLVDYTFVPSMSSGLLTDTLTTMNMPLISTNTLEWQAMGVGVSQTSSLYCTGGTPPGTAGTPFLASDNGRSCLFQKGVTVQSVLFSSTSNVYSIANALFGNQLADSFQLFFNYSTNTSQADVLNLQSSYGLGGKPHIVPANMFGLSKGAISVVAINITGRPTPQTPLLSGQYTGHGGSFDQILGFTQYKGNSSLSVWNGPEPVVGTDHFQFTPPVNPDSILTVWDDDVMRSVDLQFQQKVKVIDRYDAYRFVPTADLWSGNDSHYFGGPGQQGLLSVSPASMVKYGAPVYGYASRAYQAGVTGPLAGSVICSNCPDMSDPKNWQDVYVDIEPNTGKVLGGKKRGQINVLIGQSNIYNNPGSYAYRAYGKIPLSLVPVVYFEYSSQVEVGDQTNTLDDAEDQMKLARIGTQIFFYLTMPLSFLNFIGAFTVSMRAYHSKNTK